MTAATARLIRTKTAPDAAKRLYADHHPTLADHRSNAMHLLTQELAHERIAQRRRDADAHRLVRQAVLARRAKRSTVKAVLRARLVALAVH